MSALILAGCLGGTAQAAAPGGGAWFAASGSGKAARAVPRGPAQSATGGQSTARQQAQARLQLSRSIANLNRTANAIAAQQAAQEAARGNAPNADWVRDGVGADGLDRLAGGRWDAGEIDALGVGADGRHKVTITQNKSRAILDWNSFHVGRNTDLKFVQGASDAVLNRVRGADTRPSQIQGTVQGDGTVMVVNQNGVVFSGSSQVNVRNLVVAAANITDQQFENGLYNGADPTFTGAAGQIDVQRGAVIQTMAPSGSTAGGGYVLLLGKQVDNAGTLIAPKGQVALAAGDSFVIRKGQGTEGNQASTTRGNEVVASGAGRVANTGLIYAPIGDITLTASEVRQEGVAVATTSVDVRGTIHLNASTADGKVVLGQDSATAILLADTDTTALDGQRDSLQAPAVDTSDENIIPADRYRRDLSLVEIKSGGTVDFEGGSLTLATGGQIAVDAGARALVRDDAVLDVSGAIGVKVAMESNNLNIWVQGNEQRDAPVNRDSANLNSNELWIDRRSLVYVSAGTNGYESDRWYTAGGLLEVGGYLATSGRGVDQWMAQGGVVSFTGGDVVTRAGSLINLSGGTLDVQSGYIRQSWLRGANGRLYEVSRAPGDVLYEGLYRGYELTSERWQHTRHFYSPLIAPSRRWESGYTVGRDAGTLVIGTRNAVLEGQLVGETFQGQRQTQAAQSGLDGYYQSQRAVARGGSLVVGAYTPYYAKDSGTLQYNLTANENTIQNVVFNGAAEKVAAGLDLDTGLPEDRQGKLYLDTSLIDEAGLGSVRIAARNRISVEDDLRVGNGGDITLYSETVAVNADIVSHGGTILLGNVLHQVSSNRRFEDTILGDVANASVTLAAGATIDASGLWSNLLLDPENLANFPFQEGGNVSIRSTGDVLLAKGSVIDVSSGAAILTDGRYTGGRGGDVTLHSGVNQSAGKGGMLTVDGDIRGYGVAGGGTLSLQSGGTVVVGNELALTADGTLSAGGLLVIGLTLADDYTVGAGEILPTDVTLVRVEAPFVPGGQALPSDAAFIDLVRAAGGTLVAQRLWTIPANVTGTFTGINPNTGRTQVYRAGSTVGVGTIFNTTTSGANNLILPSGMVIPGGVFSVAGRDGVQLPETEVRHSYAAGTAAPEDIVLAAGTLVQPGFALQREARFDVLQLPSGYFNRGFSQYQVAGLTGALVSQGSAVDVAMPVYRRGAGAHRQATVEAPGAALELWMPPLYQEDPVAGTLTRRAGASFSLRAGSTEAAAADLAVVQAIIGRYAVVNVDPGQTIEVRSIGQLTVEGTLRAPGGDILLGEVPLPATTAEPARSEGHGRSIWVGEQAVLDVSGRATLATDTLGRRYGLVDAGGSIVVGGAFDAGQGLADAADLFVVVRPGALLDASGTKATIDVPGLGASEVASAGGDITVASSNGLYLDGTLRAEAGGDSAAGGSLTLALNTPIYRNTADSRVRQARELTLSQWARPSLSLGLDPAAAADQLVYGRAGVAAEQVAAGGFDSVTLASDGLLSFEGDVSLATGYSMNLYARVMSLAEGAAESSRVQLSAPYIHLASYGGELGGDGRLHPTVTGGVSERAPVGMLSINAGRLLQVAGNLTFGGRGGTGASVGLPAEVDRRGFDKLLLSSAGDIRFLGGDLYTPGDLSLAAAQLYPGTGASAALYAGWRGTSAALDPDRVLSVARTTDVIPELPYSVFGRLTLAAANIEQGGVVRAPLGRVELGSETNLRGSRNVSLLAGSLTSVSADGLVMPYGGTKDGQAWQYAGEKINLAGVGSLAAGRVTLTSQHVDVQAGAVIDLSGGGELTGAGFVSGRGGSTDARYHPLVQIGRNGFTLPGLSSNPVYAIVPGVQAPAAPAGGEAGAVDPVVGQQITLGDGVPGLPAGTYTLLPSTYALLPGAFRVEINGLSSIGRPTASHTVRNGSWSAAGRLSIAGTRFQDSLFQQVILTPADVLRSYSQYNETPYSEFVRADAATLGVPRAQIEADAKTLRLALLDREQDSRDLSLRFAGEVRGEAGKGGYGSTLAVTGSTIEILADDAVPSSEYAIALRSSELNRVKVNRLAIGGMPRVAYGQGGNIVRFDGQVAGENVSPADSLVVRSGAQLYAPEVMLIGSGFLDSTNSISVEQGAVINTLGRGAVAYDSADGFIYQPGSTGVVSVSNGLLRWLASEKAGLIKGPSPILIGGCASGACGGSTQLYSEGSIAFVTDNDFQLDDAVRYGTRHLSLAVGAFNIGSGEALAAASARGALTPGLALTQQMMERLLQGDTSTGAPALETLELIAGQSVNFFDTVTLSTLDASGASLLDNLMITTPAIYGYGDSADMALIRTGHLIWNGSGDAPGPVVNGGAGTGTGSLQIEAQKITFGYGTYGQADGVSKLGRMALGFANVNLVASDRVSANNAGTLAIYQSQGEYVSGEGWQYSGGNLNVVTPLWTGESGSTHQITVGGAINVTAPATGAADPSAVTAIGAELSLTAALGLNLDTTVALPSGKLALEADGSVVLGNGATVDVSGRSVTFFDDNDATQYSWGGDVSLRSTNGDVVQASASLIDLSAENNNAGRLTAIALGEAAGSVDLQGAIDGTASGYYDAGGTYVPYLAGAVDIRAQRLGVGAALTDAFSALNQRLNEGQVFGRRSFQLKQGDLVIGNGLRANQIEVSLDAGHLAVTGMVDASGERVGMIRLAGRQGLTLASGAVLDAHGTLLRLDSYGKIVDAPNRAVVELSSGAGLLTMANGARIDLRHGTNDARVAAMPALHDGRALGTLELNAPRIDADGRVDTDAAATYGDIAIDVRGAVDVQGVKSIAVNAVQRYDDAPAGTDEAAGGRPYQIITQAYLDGKHSDSVAFINAALANGTLLNTKLAGLSGGSLRDVFHLRPGVEIVSATPDGDIVISGDLDLSGHRYASLNPATQKTGIYGSGEPGALVIRAGGNLNIYGSVNDGFSPPPDTPDDNGWVLTPGTQGYGGDVVVPGAGVQLAEGTVFPADKTLNYAVPLQALTLPAGTELPVAATLVAGMTLPAGTVVGAEIRDASGRVLAAAGAVLGDALSIPAGAVLGAGMRLPAQAQVEALTWPANVALPVAATLARDVSLPVGALIPSMTNVKLVDGAPLVELRTVSGDRMGRNWAVAKMLPEGSLSWSLRLVAGADLDAADPRLTRPDATGRLVLADTHYGLYKTFQPGGIQVWTQEAIDYWQVDVDWADYGLSGPVKVGDAVADPQEWGFCSDPSVTCGTATHVWTQEGIAGWETDNYWQDYGLSGPPAVGDPVVDPQGWLFCDMPGSCLELPGDTVKAAYPVTQNFSVLRTGTGDLDLIAGGDVAMHSLYGVYTAGASSASRGGAQAGAFNQPRAKGGGGDDTYLNTSMSADPGVGVAYEAVVNGGENSTYGAWYPDGGGNLLLRAGGDFTGDVLASRPGVTTDIDLRPQRGSADLGNWLWRQGSGDTQGVDRIPTSWWINFGTYVRGPDAELTNTLTGVPYEDRYLVGAIPELVGFTGVGTLGGGNLTVQVSGDAGLISRRGDAPGSTDPQRSAGLILAVGSTGRVLDNGDVLMSGGGDLRLDLGGALNPGLAARSSTGSRNSEASPFDYRRQNLDLNGVLANLRGSVRVQAGSLGGIALSYFRSSGVQVDQRETRAFDPYSASLGAATGGPVIMLGDSAASLSSRGDLVLSGAGDPGRVALPVSMPYSQNGGERQAGGYGWFSLWTDNTAIRLFSAGGDVTPSVQIAAVEASGLVAAERNYSATDGRFVWPGQLSTVAANGSIFIGPSALGQASASEYNAAYSLLLAPSRNGRLEVLAGDSIYAGGYVVSRSAAPMSALPTPLDPAFGVFRANDGGLTAIHNLDAQAIRPTVGRFPIFAFGPNTATSLVSTASPVRFYAREGDILGLGTGEVLAFSSGGRAGQTWYEGLGPVWMRAGGDIVRSGTLLSESVAIPSEIKQTPSSTNLGSASSTGNLFIHSNANDVSIVEAGGEILFSNFMVAGPGTLEISAGGNIVMVGQAARSGSSLNYGESSITSLGPVVPGDSRPGANIVVQAGMGSRSGDWNGFLARYLNPDNLADPERPLADQEGDVAHTYEAELAAWLADRYGFSPTADESTAEQALAFFATLPGEQQRIFARFVYFSELRAGGREYNDQDGPRFGSYLRGRNAIEALFPERDPDGSPAVYGGNLFAYGGAGIHTNAGGDIQVLTPAGAQTYGVEGEAPPSTAGVVTLGQGDIQLYSLGSILLGQSRIMTTFGGSILGWSAEGDINAGRGSRTSVVYTPPRRIYDAFGNVAISPDVPGTGAGIATLAPIPEVPPGDVDLIAPLGTIDAGEAGIRVSGNVNIAALQVVNAANIQTQGESSGIPVVAAVNVGALTSASSAATNAASAAQDAVSRSRAAAQRALPSIISVQILGFGDGSQAPAPAPAPAPSRAPAANGRATGEPVSYDPGSAIQLMNSRSVGQAGQPALTDKERANML
ncbi:filamentous haemagglutinin family protein [Bordetella genomosp. 13]